tara:strand:- start:435 stop:650 length:216 start_codon:yes stop_codon:yes gene_type:complete
MLKGISDKFFAVISALIIIGSIFVFSVVFSSDIEDLKITKNGVPILISDVINPENGKVISIDDLVHHYKGK